MIVAADIMTTDVIAVTAETPVAEVAELLAANKFGSVPVVGVDDDVVGLVSEEDLVERASRVHLPNHVVFLGAVIYLENPAKFRVEAEKILALTAGDIMHTQVYSVSPDTPVEELATRMLDGVRRVLVLDADRRLLGIITRADIVRMFTTGGRLPGEA
jgi:CBS domain-containing protein